MSTNSKRPILIILIILFVGCLLGTMLQSLINGLIPEGSLVYNFFNEMQQLGFGDYKNNPDGWIDLGILRFKLGFEFDLGILSILGLAISWYFLRYFK